MQLLENSNWQLTIKTRVKHYSQTWAYRGAPLPTEELESAAYTICAEALNTYDPTKGAAFNTYLWSQLGRLKHIAWQEQRRLHREAAEIRDDMMVGMSSWEEPDGELLLDDLSPDAQEVAKCLLERGVRKGKAPGIKSTAFYMGWPIAQVEAAWEELTCWWRTGGIPDFRQDANTPAEVYNG